jgi:ArsR family transcriptional regulator
MLLLRDEELCVCELTYAIGVSQPHISRHLAQLRELGLVADRRVGVWVHYRITPAIPDWVRQVLAECLHGLGHQSPFSDDAQALSSMPNRPGAARCA